MQYRQNNLPGDKNYRVWEANRKVFLNPENFLSPNILDVKSELMIALEEKLLQRSITSENVEHVYKQYLNDLHTVSNLKITGTYCHQEAGRRTLYLFGRTSGDPIQYFYRTLDGRRFNLDSLGKIRRSNSC